MLADQWKSSKHGQTFATDVGFDFVEDKKKYCVQF
jgi:hypothetical protein